ncbi:MAG: hypothetical protein BWK78_04585 [Thiotrichaceae bacterium IS1]|nr:MAG: hypothetical protein BWK78_04585 [Thiotrichaceae bacterium IS1]
MRYVSVALVCLIIGFSSFSVYAGPLCTYQARISEQDKYNSNDESLLQGKKVSTAIAAAIIRQDRANYHEFDKRDAEDEDDCVFADKGNRAELEKRLTKHSIDKSVLRQIIFDNPLIRVKVYADSISITILLEESE